MNYFKFISYFVLVVIYLQCFGNLISCSPLQSNSIEKYFDGESPRFSYRAAESQQVEDIQKPIKQEPTKQEPTKQEPTKQEPTKQEPIKQEPIKQEPIKQEPIKQEPTKTVQEPQIPEKNDKIEETTCTECVKPKPDFSKAVAIAAKGNILAAAATAKVAAPFVIKSAKVAGLASLIPVKLAAKGAIIGGLIAKPFLIKSALVGATAVKLSHLFVGKPIAIGSNLLAGAEALRAKLDTHKQGCVSTGCETTIL